MKNTRILKALLAIVLFVVLSPYIFLMLSFVMPALIVYPFYLIGWNFYNLIPYPYYPVFAFGSIFMILGIFYALRSFEKKTQKQG